MGSAEHKKQLSRWVKKKAETVRNTGERSGRVQKIVGEGGRKKSNVSNTLGWKSAVCACLPK